MKRPFTNPGNDELATKKRKNEKKEQPQDDRFHSVDHHNKQKRNETERPSSKRIETLEERDARKAIAKEAKKRRKELARQQNDDDDRLDEPTSSSSIRQLIHNKDDDERLDAEDADLEEEEDEEEDDGLKSAIFGGDRIRETMGKSVVDQLRPSTSHDESKKVKMQKKRDEDEDFNDELFDDSVILAPEEPMSVSDAMKIWGLDEELAKNLMEDGIDGFFPVQRAVIPHLLRSNVRTCVFPRDMCVSAPTGSGKTIAYALPILHTLKSRTIVRLRALLLLPSRELANQVYRVFSRLARGTDLGVAVCTGQTPLEEEQRLIMGACFTGGMVSAPGRSSSSSSSSSSSRTNNIGGVSAASHVDGFFSNRDLYFRSNSVLGNSAVDILICTPGRLLDHIQHTADFTLQHLRFLVLDEADRLLGNAYHSWVRTLVQSAHTTQSTAVSDNFKTFHQRDVLSMDTAIEASIKSSFAANTEEILPTAATLPFLAISQRPLQRLLFSATLTDNPRKLAMLGINNPLIVRAHLGDSDRRNTKEHTEQDDEGKITSALSTSGYILPSTLEESMIVCETARRPLLLVSLLIEAVGIPKQFSIKDTTMKVTKSDKSGHTSLSNICAKQGTLCVIFSSSVETTHRLCRLLQLVNQQHGSNRSVFGGRVAEMSRLMRSDERELIMTAAAKGDIKILVSSDHMARGIDLPNIKLIVNYDPPKHAKTYVHRVGRTARANRYGHSLTLLKEGQVGVFRKMRATINTQEQQDEHKDQKIGGLLKCKVNADLEKLVEPIYAKALKQLSDVMVKESRGELTVGADLTF